MYETYSFVRCYLGNLNPSVMAFYTFIYVSDNENSNRKRGA